MNSGWFQVPAESDLLPVPDYYDLALEESVSGLAMALMIRWPITGQAGQLQTTEILGRIERWMRNRSHRTGERTGTLRFAALPVSAWSAARQYARGNEHNYWIMIRSRLGAEVKPTVSNLTVMRSLRDFSFADPAPEVVPEPEIVELGWVRAEHDVARWLERLGAKNVRVTQQTRDGGADVVADGVVAEVKYWTAGSISRKDVAALKGASRGRLPIFFSTAPYTTAAAAEADDLGVALFWFDKRGLQVDPRNDFAQQVLDANGALLELGQRLDRRDP